MQQTANVFHDSTYEDLDKLILSQVWAFVRRRGLRFEDVGEDLVQECWCSVLKASNVYQPKGYRFSTYCWYWISNTLKKHKVNDHSSVDDFSEYQTEEYLSYEPSFEDGMDFKDLLADIEGSEYLILNASGYTDSEIGEILPDDANVHGRRFRSLAAFEEKLIEDGIVDGPIRTRRAERAALKAREKNT